MAEEKSPQSLFISSSQVSGQVGQAGRDLTQTQQISTTPEKQLTSADVASLLTQIEELIRSANLPDSEEEKAVKYLDTAKEETQQNEPDKDLAAKSLKRVTETLKNASETVNAGQGLWKNVQPIVTQLLSWLGVAAHFFGF